MRGVGKKRANIHVITQDMRQYEEELVTVHMTQDKCTQKPLRTESQNSGNMHKKSSFFH